MTAKLMVIPCIIILSMGLSNLRAQEGKISGYMFGDYFYEFSHPDSATDALNRNGFQFRRIYFTYDRELSERFAVRFRLEMNSPDFGKSDPMTPYIKHAYLSWKKLIPASQLYFGVSPTPTWNVSEEVWGYRSVEKTIMDLRKVASSSDFGLALQGKIGKAGVLNYHLMIANGAGTKGETDKNKRVYLNVPIKIQKAYYLVPYFDYEGGNDGKDKNLLAVFAGIQKPNFHGGVEVFQKTSNKALANNADKTETGFSIFGAVKAAEKVKLFGRFDVYDPNTDVDNDGNTFLVAGLDFAPEKNINLMPNLKIESYQAEGKDSNIVGALTFFFRF
ncbi:MAG: hypothetical protein ONB44_16355 [candidate division KSB1 bacterium]|nr:hypothetical protein [candidate division KSB1 bacterium]MDZ7303706.1 hypothetical protein [candidate division KSB1 bacterium]MDZ7313158.1 hypothetical protein [candidate division KSB1 bacterium]